MKILAAFLVLLMLTGCQYYRVTDVSTGKTYITRSDKLDIHGPMNTAKFYDYKTGHTVNLQAYETQKISEADAKSDLQPPRAYLRSSTTRPSTNATSVPN